MSEISINKEENSKRSRNFSVLLWVLPSTSGILLLIALFTPTAVYSQYGYSWSWWMWDYMDYMDTSAFITELGVIIPSIITTSVILISMINLFIIAFKSKYGSLNMKKISLRSVISAVSSIGVMIYYMISIQLVLHDGFYTESLGYFSVNDFWNVFEIGFGTILPFVSGFLSFVEIGVFRYVSNRNDIMLLSTQGPMTEELLAKKIRGLYTLSGIFPLVAGYLALIAIACPTADINIGYVNWSWWMWDLIMMKMSGYPPILLFIFQGEYVVLSLITTAVIIFSSINLIMLSKSIRMRKSNTKDYLTWSIVSAVLSIAIMIYYIIAIENAFFSGLSIEGTSGFPPGYPFWDVFKPGFGLILPFMSAAMAFGGIVVYLYYISQKKAISLDDLKIVLEKRQLKKLRIPVLGISSLLIGGLGIFYLIYNFIRWYTGSFEYLIYPMVLCIISWIIGMKGRKWEATKGVATGGATIGVVGTITSMIILSYFIFIINYLLYADI